jgi:hypothetical protein
MPARSQQPPAAPLGDLLAHLHAVVTAQVDALDRDDLAAVEALAPDRDALVTALDRYRAADLRPTDRALLEQIAALDQRLIASARQSIDQATLELRSIFRGHGALQRYQRRGQALIGALTQLDVAR